MIKGKATAVAIPSPRPANGYQSVSIVRASKSCDAVKAVGQRRFLAGSAPVLPLPDCTMSAQCRCKFQKHADRREDHRRLPGESSRWYPGPEKRVTHGRRKGD